MSKSFDFKEPRAITSKDPVADFDCEVEILNRYLQKHAFQAQQGEGARTYVTFSLDGNIAGYFTLAYGSVEHDKVPERVTKGLARHPIPVMLLARLAVDKRFKGQGLGKELMRDAMLRTLNAAEIAGLRAIVVDAKDDDAKAFYKHYGFEAFKNEPMRLSLILKDVRALIGKN
ncbi:GNAT family N-acetyltransferase [soil metagenome]